MNYLLLHRLKIQNANAIAGFTWGFPAITHFLGFTHKLERRLSHSRNLKGIQLFGCTVTSHEQQTHTYGNSSNKQFTQFKTPPYLPSHTACDSAPVIEEGRMNMTVSLLIGIKGNINVGSTELPEFIENCCYTQRLAGGTILEIGSIEVISDDRQIKRKLLPGFTLMERSEYLETHYKSLLAENSEADMLDAWLDFSVIKQAARPQHNLICQYIKKQDDKSLRESWENHLEIKPYSSDNIPHNIQNLLTKLDKGPETQTLLAQWDAYCNPDESKTPAIWEYLDKPARGFLVPLMTGYKAISPLYDNKKVANTRDSETPVCFVEAAHSIGEWVSPHRIDNLEESLWNYHYEENWYLCKQKRRRIQLASATG